MYQCHFSVYHIRNDFFLLSMPIAASHISFFSLMKIPFSNCTFIRKFHIFLQDKTLKLNENLMWKSKWNVVSIFFPCGLARLKSMAMQREKEKERAKKKNRLSPQVLPVTEKKWYVPSLWCAMYGCVRVYAYVFQCG